VVKVPSSGQRIQSLETAGKLLSALADSTGPLTLTELARIVGMPTSKAHRYLASFCRFGLIAQNETTLRYDLGPLALRTGLAYLRRLDGMDLARQAIGALRDRVEETVALSIWGPEGPSIIDYRENPHSALVNVRIGWVMPPNSATGQLFMAFLPPHITADYLERWPAYGRRPGAGILRKEREALRRNIPEIRKTGLAIARVVVPGINAVAAPVFDANGELKLAITILTSVVSRPSLEPGGSVAKALAASATRLSQALGYSAPQPPAKEAAGTSRSPDDTNGRRRRSAT
jgi:DNA-binding IclR family transcriptional regulator